MKIIKIFLVIGISAAIIPTLSHAATYELDTAHTSVQFGVRHLGINTVRGSFTELKGTIDYNPAKPEETKISAEIDSSSLSTGNTKRDEHVKSKDFLDVSKFSKITFVSKSAKSTGKNSLDVTGDLTILGHTKEVVLQVSELSGPGLNPLDKKNHVGASATTKITRQDFGVTWNGGGITGIAGETAIGDEIKIQIEVDGVETATKK